MIHNSILDWLIQSLLGVGCSLIATGMVSLILGSAPLSVAFCLVVGVVLMVLALVVRIIRLIPSDS